MAIKFDEDSKIKEALNDLEDKINFDNLSIDTDELKKDFGNFKEKFLAFFKKYITKATDLLKDDEKMNKFFCQVEDVLNKIPVDKIPKVGPLLKDKFPLGDIAVLLSMVRAYFLKQYRDIDVKNIIIAMIGLLYLVTPIDIIPDFIIGAGWIDDAVVLIGIIKLLDDEVNKYKKWYEENKDVVGELTNVKVDEN